MNQTVAICRQLHNKHSRSSHLNVFWGPSGEMKNNGLFRGQEALDKTALETTVTRRLIHSLQHRLMLLARRQQQQFADQWKVVYVCTTINKPDTKSNANPTIKLNNTKFIKCHNVVRRLQRRI